MVEYNMKSEFRVFKNQMLTQLFGPIEEKQLGSFVYFWAFFIQDFGHTDGVFKWNEKPLRSLIWKRYVFKNTISLFVSIF